MKYQTQLIFIVLFIAVVPLLAADPNTQADSSRTAGGYSLMGDSLSRSPRLSYTEESYSQVIWVSIVFLLMLIAALWLFKRGAGSALRTSDAKIRVLSRYALSPRQSIMIVALENRKFALGATDHAIHTLADLGPLTDDDKTGTPPEKLNTFGELLKKMGGKQ